MKTLGFAFLLAVALAPAARAQDLPTVADMLHSATVSARRMAAPEMSVVSSRSNARACSDLREVDGEDLVATCGGECRLLAKNGKARLMSFRITGGLDEKSMKVLATITIRNPGAPVGAYFATLYHMGATFMRPLLTAKDRREILAADAQDADKPSWEVAQMEIAAGLSRLPKPTLDRIERQPARWIEIEPFEPAGNDSLSSQKPDPEYCK